ncbi:MAG: glycosyltransferase [Microcoleus sp. SIO2G3]|nr:glycosyltransferase [Microcoleus sp. SIO2G3]
MRHCQVARSCGVDAVLATVRGRDTYRERGLAGLPFIRWADRRPDDICIVPDFVTTLIDEVEGAAIAYLQGPTFTHNNFDYKSDRVQLWTDSPFMQAICERTYSGKPVTIVPNIVDNQAFPFISQLDRESGLVFAFPRKGPEFISATQQCYQNLGGQFWRFELIDGLPFHELAQQFRRPQVFLASAEVEGCALPPQESMAAGIVVVGRTARGANFCMQHGETAMTAETPEEAAKCLFELEDAALRSHISQQAHDYISRYFPDREPKRFWQETIAQYAAETVSVTH